MTLGPTVPYQIENNAMLQAAERALVEDTAKRVTTEQYSVAISKELDELKKIV